MKKAQSEFLREVENICSRDFSVSAYTGLTGQWEALKRQKEAILSLVRGSTSKFREDT